MNKFKAWLGLQTCKFGLWFCSMMKPDEEAYDKEDLEFIMKLEKMRNNFKRKLNETNY